MKDEKITRAVESQPGRETNVGHYWSEKGRQRNGIAYQKLTMSLKNLSCSILQDWSRHVVIILCVDLQHLKLRHFHSYCSQTCHWLSQPYVFPYLWEAYAGGHLIQYAHTASAVKHLPEFPRLFVPCKVAPLREGLSAPCCDHEVSFKGVFLHFLSLAGQSCPWQYLPCQLLNHKPVIKLKSVLFKYEPFICKDHSCPPFCLSFLKGLYPPTTTSILSDLYHHISLIPVTAS